MAMFIDERANAKQREALQTIFGGQAGGWPGQFAQNIAEARGMEFAPIEFELAGDLATWRAAIPGRVEAKAEALSGPTTSPGQRVQTINPPGSEIGPGPNVVATWGNRDNGSSRCLRLQVEPQRAIEQAHTVLVDRAGMIAFASAP
jgi:hypothetical protein